jgi:hypothetical protein
MIACAKNLHHVGAEITELHRCKRAGYHPAQIKDSHLSEGGRCTP